MMGNNVISKGIASMMAFMMAVGLCPLFPGAAFAGDGEIAPALDAQSSSSQSYTFEDDGFTVMVNGVTSGKVSYDRDGNVLKMVDTTITVPKNGRAIGFSSNDFGANSKCRASLEVRLIGDNVVSGERYTWLGWNSSDGNSEVVDAVLSGTGSLHLSGKKYKGMKVRDLSIDGPSIHMKAPSVAVRARNIEMKAGKLVAVGTRKVKSAADDSDGFRSEHGGIRCSGDFAMPGGKVSVSGFGAGLSFESGQKDDHGVVVPRRVNAFKVTGGILKANRNSGSGICAPDANRLTLKVKGGKVAANKNGGNGISCSKFKLSGGTVTAKGNKRFGVPGPNADPAEVIFEIKLASRHPSPLAYFDEKREMKATVTGGKLKVCANGGDGFACAGKAVIKNASITANRNGSDGIQVWSDARRKCSLRIIGSVVKANKNKSGGVSTSGPLSISKSRVKARKNSMQGLLVHGELSVRKSTLLATGNGWFGGDIRCDSLVNNGSTIEGERG